MKNNELLISGSDAESFLQRQASNDLKDLSKPVYTAFLKANAEIISLALIEKNKDQFCILTKNPDELKSHLEKFAIIEDLVILSETKDPMQDDELDDYEPGESFIKFAEAQPEKKLLEKYVSFTKGCFPGQEPLAKFKNIGLKKREERSQKLLDEALDLFAHAKTPQELDPTIELLRKALKENPRNEDAMESLGVMLAKQEKYQEAIQIMHMLEMINPKNEMAQMNLSIFYMKIGDKETAEEHKAKGTVLAFEKALSSQ